MAIPFTSSSLLAVFLAILAFYSSIVAAQGMSVVCSTCLQQKLVTVPQCTNVDMKNNSQQNTPEYRECICWSSYDFNWTLSCRDTGVCQPSEVTSFQQSYNAIFAALNLTCVKPTPSPTPSSSASKIGGRSTFLRFETAAAGTVVMTMLAGGIGAFLVAVGF